MSGSQDSSERHSQAAGSHIAPASSEKDRQTLRSLHREKKQKACANCRKAKLKCIFGDDQVCVRCKARHEQCVSYPRAHDEDWQQNVTTDLGTTTSYLQYLSEVVHSLSAQLVERGIVPSFEAAGGFRVFQAPERDYPWQRDVEAEAAADEPPMKRRRRKTVTEESQQDGPLHGIGVVTSTPRSQDSHDNQATSSRQPAPYPSSSTPASFLPPKYTVADPAQSSSRSTLQHSFGQQDLPMELFAPRNGTDLLGDSSEGLFDYNIRTNSPMSTGRDMPTAVPGTASEGPSSLGQGPSPEMGHAEVDGDAGVSQIVHSMAGSYDVMGYADGLDTSNQTVKAAGRPDQLGGCDPRQNIVTKGLLSNDVALRLVDFFHDNVAISLHGFTLRFRNFPYVADGPAYITPFILSVLCWVSSLRLAGHSEYNKLLTHEIYNVLIHSPAGSFYNMRVPYNAQDHESDDPLDPELGIGPEEIVGTLILAMFVEDRSEASTLASSAFRWARSWMDMTVASTSLTGDPVSFTQGELDGRLPIRRVASTLELARTWLFCYVVDGTEAIMCGRARFTRRDPARHIATLINNDENGQQALPHDVVLAFHARLIACLGDFLHRQDQFRASLPAGEAFPILRYARLTSSTNSQLQFWMADLEGYDLPLAESRRLMMAFYFARILVNHPSVGIFANNGKDYLASAAESLALEAAFAMLETCTAWEPRNDLHHLPWSSYRMITLAGGVLQGLSRASTAGSVYTPEEAISLLRTISLLLFPHSRTSGRTGEDETYSTASHGARKTAASLLSVSHGLEHGRLG